MKSNRRNFLKKSSAGALSLGIGMFALPKTAHGSVTNNGLKHHGRDLKLGVASFTLREFSMEDALDMTLRCDIHRMTFKSMHLPLKSSPEAIRRAVAICKNKGVELYGAGVVYMKSRAEVDQAFEYAKTAEMEMIIGVPNHELLDYVEEKVKAFDIKLAIHNHGPGDDLYPSAESAYVRVKNRDKRMGLCIDIGHTKRIKRDPSKDLTDFFDRVYDVHLKDVTADEADGKTCIIGRGVIDLPAFLKTASTLGYSGTLALEYEAEAKDPLPGMMESIGYVKGILSTL